MNRKKAPKTKFNDAHPNAYNIQLGSDGITWGIWFNLPHKKKVQFLPINGLQTINVEILQQLEFSPNMNDCLKEEDSKLCLN